MNENVALTVTDNNIDNQLYMPHAALVQSVTVNKTTDRQNAGSAKESTRKRHDAPHLPGKGPTRHFTKDNPTKLTCQGNEFDIEHQK